MRELCPSALLDLKFKWPYLRVTISQMDDEIPELIREIGHQVAVKISVDQKRSMKDKAKLKITTIEIPW